MEEAFVERYFFFFFFLVLQIHCLCIWAHCWYIIRLKDMVSEKVTLPRSNLYSCYYAFPNLQWQGKCTKVAIRKRDQPRIPVWEQNNNNINKGRTCWEEPTCYRWKDHWYLVEKCSSLDFCFLASSDRGKLVRNSMNTTCEVSQRQSSDLYLRLHLVLVRRIRVDRNSHFSL